MRIVNKTTGETISTIITNHSMSLDEAIDLVGTALWDEDDASMIVEIGGKVYDYDELEIKGDCAK